MIDVQLRQFAELATLAALNDVTVNEITNAYPRCVHDNTNLDAKNSVAEYMIDAGLTTVWVGIKSATDAATGKALRELL